MIFKHFSEILNLVQQTGGGRVEGMLFALLPVHPQHCNWRPLSTSLQDGTHKTMSGTSLHPLVATPGLHHHDDLNSRRELLSAIAMTGSRARAMARVMIRAND